MIRYRMKKLINLLENNNLDGVYKLIKSPKYAKALSALSDMGCVSVNKAWGGNIISINLLDHHATYQLERFEVWFNRVLGFTFGVVSSLIDQFLIKQLL